MRRSGFVFCQTMVKNNWTGGKWIQKSLLLEILRLLSFNTEFWEWVSSWNCLGRVSLIKVAFCSDYEMCTKIKLDFFQISKTMEPNHFRFDNSLSSLNSTLSQSFFQVRKCWAVEHAPCVEEWGNNHLLKIRLLETGFLSRFQPNPKIRCLV